MTCNGMTTVRVVRLRTIARREKTHYFRFDWQHKLQPGMLSFYMKNTNKLHKHRRENHTKATSLYLWFLRARARTQNHHDRARHPNRVCVVCLSSSSLQRCQKPRIHRQQHATKFVNSCVGFTRKKIIFVSIEFQATGKNG